MAIRYKDSNGNWITGQKAIETQLIDAQGNFVATNVEDALQEIKVEVDSLSQDMIEVKEDIEWLKENGGGGENGGIELTSTFDYEVEYGITDDIRLTYNIETDINEEIKLHLNINGVETEHVSQNGNNFIDLKASDLGVGTHPVTMYAKVDKYVSRELRFNIVVVFEEDSNTSVVVLDIPSDNYKVTVTMRTNFGDYSVLFSEPPLIAWGDDSTSVGDSVLEGTSTKDFSHTYARAGKYEVKLKNGTFWYNNHGSFKDNIYKIVSLHDKFPIAENHFRQSSKLVEANISNAVIDGEYIIYYCPKLTKVIANNVKATNIKYCFASCSKLTEIIGLDTWNTDELTNMAYAFEKTPLTSLKDIAGWNTENVVDMSNMFQDCTSLTSANLSGWDTSSVTKMTKMFLNCSSLTTFISMPISVSISFSGCNNLTVDSLMSIVNNLATVTTTQTLTIGSTNIAKLTTEQIKIATDKNWTLA